MRAVIIALPLLLIAAPAAAAPREPLQLPPEMTDPAMGQKLGRMAGALSRALMDVKVGEIKAIAEGREASAAERRQTVGDLAGGPAAADRIERQVAAAGPAIQNGVQAMARALPAIMTAMEGVAADLERATANLPDPTYPRR
jgi:hypothetical protein